MILFGFAVSKAGISSASNDLEDFSSSTVKEWSDNFFLEQMAKRSIPGAVIVVVQGDQVVFQSGYGWADLDEKRPMDPRKTVIRLGSISKVFTAMVVAQLLESGGASLQDPISKYLGDDFERDSHSELDGPPVRLIHLLTHTAGYDDRVVGLVAENAKGKLPLGEYLHRRLPQRFVQPGRQVSYSNHGFAVVGRILEKVYGKPYEQLMKDQILDPLEMTDSAFKLSLDLWPRVAKGYESLGGSDLAMAPFDFIQTAPASSLLSTAHDMGKFLKAQFKTTPALSTRGLAMMQTQQFSHHPALDGFGLSWFEYHYKGHMVWNHGGETRGFGNRMIIVPDQNLGIYIGYNMLGLQMTGAFFHGFLDRFVGGGPNEDVKASPRILASRTGVEPSVDLGQLEGYFRQNRYPRTSYAKLGTFIAGMSAEYWLEAESSRSFSLFRMPGVARIPGVFELRSSDDQGDVYENVTAKQIAVVRAAPGGRPQLFMSRHQEGALNQIPWYQALFVHLFLGIFGLTAFIFVLFRERKRAITFYRRRLGGGRRSFWRWDSNAPYVTLWTLAVLHLFSIALVGVALLHPVDSVYGTPFELQIVFGVFILNIGFTVLFPVAAIVYVMKENSTFFQKAYLSLMVVLASSYLLVAHHWNLVGYQY